ncbi:11306_t:CDS:2 [Paraglomus brasilianum]|uniref:11306_t:CDS:1 n=1 Tax=Paraglomus brasilianum TaxID=144538 RepID=A0A9N9FUA8_9GLOM|nr:11306_t:CDS:2 [Paraglomus brasilianum]
MAYNYAQQHTQYQAQTTPDSLLASYFAAVDVDRSGSITTKELKQGLKNGDWTPFNDDTVQLLFNLFDTDRSGCIGYHEFAGLWRYIEDWRRVFIQVDRNKSGAIEMSELKQALVSFGFSVSDPLLYKIIKKYEIRHGSSASLKHHQPYGHGHNEVAVNFDNFVQMCVTIRTLTDAFRKVDSDHDGWIQIGYEGLLSLLVTNM